MAQTGFTPIQIYSSSTAAAAPVAGNLTNSTLGSELAINITDGKLFYKDNANAIQVIGWKVVPATAGGTGQTSYAVGDILYANTTTTLAKLADVATGNALISGGVGVAPAWGKIGLTTHVSGTLGVGNGGTGTATAFTAGSVVFSGASGVYSQNNSGLFWDNSNVRLGIGTAAPSVAFHVEGGNARINRASNATILTFGGSPSNNWEGDIQFLTSNNQINWRIASNRAVSGSFSITPSTATGGSTFSTPAFLIDPTTNNVGIGTNTPGQKLEVAGNQRFTGSQVGTKIENRANVISVSTATTILDDAGALGRFAIVNGESGGNRFCDLILCSTSVTPTVVASFTAVGSPAARTYTRSGSAVQLAMASGTYGVYVLALGY
jgi:hypothetical protein